jgi:outer membrane biosynthesis protein TonB
LARQPQYVSGMKALLVAALLASVTAPTVAHAEFSAPRRPIDWKLATGKAKATKAPAKAAFATKEEAEIEQPTLSVDNVMSKINTVYMTGLQRCDQKSLKAEPTVSGKVTLTFTVDTKGRVLSDLDGLTPVFDHCLTTMISTWRFPHVREPSEATFKLSLMLMK